MTRSRVSRRPAPGDEGLRCGALAMRPLPSYAPCDRAPPDPLVDPPLDPPHLIMPHLIRPFAAPEPDCASPDPPLDPLLDPLLYLPLDPPLAIPPHLIVPAIPHHVRPRLIPRRVPLLMRPLAMVPWR